MDIRILLVTAPDIKVAKEIAHSTVNNSLAACISVLPNVTSVYSWEGETHEDSEVQLIIKTKLSKLDKLKEHIFAIHPYDCPELISLPTDWVEPSYLNWMNSLLKQDD